MKDLILTNLNKFEIRDENFEFLGPWCFRDLEDKEKYWDQVKFEALFQNGKEFEEASKYIISFAEKLLVQYSKKLNKLHKRNYSEEYWSILLMSWIIRSLEIFFIRYKDLIKLNDNQYSVSIFDQEIKAKFDNSRNFYNYLLSEHGQHYSYSVLIEYLKLENLKINYIKDDKEKKPTKHQKNIDRHNIISEYRRSIKQIMSIFFANIFGVYIDGIKGIGVFNVMSIGLKLSSIKNKKENTISPDNKLKTEIKSEKKYKDFEEFIENCLFELIPESLTTDFKKYEFKSKKKLNLLSKKHKVLIVGAIMGGIESQRYFLAHFKEERKGKIAVSQHGGLSYGIMRTFPSAAMIEYKNADYFLSWGWCEHSDYQVNAIPVASPLLSRKINSRKSVSNEIILVGAQARLVNDRLSSRIQTEQCNNYRDEKIRFIESLENENIKNLFYRPYYSEIDSYPEKSFLKNKVPSIRFIDDNFDKRLVKAKCVIIDHPGTTFEISLAINIPTLLFWNKSSWLQTDEGEQVLEMLEEAKIFHPNGKSAATFLNSISNNIDSWWNSKEVKDAKNHYQKQYALTSQRWEDEWVQLINKLNN